MTGVSGTGGIEWDKRDVARARKVPAAEHLSSLTAFHPAHSGPFALTMHEEMLARPASAGGRK